MPKTVRFELRCHPEWLACLKEAAAARGISAADYITEAVDAFHAHLAWDFNRHKSPPHRNRRPTFRRPTPARNPK